MRTVRISVYKLAECLAASRAKHVKELEQAMAGYRRLCMEALRAKLDKFEDGEFPEAHISERKPECHTSEYDRVIKMVQMSEDEVIELTDEEFQRYVEDDWGWRRQWSALNMKYASQ